MERELSLCHWYAIVLMVIKRKTLKAQCECLCSIRQERSIIYELSAPKSQRFLQFAIAMPIADPRNRCDFGDKTKQCCIAI